MRREEEKTHREMFSLTDTILHTLYRLFKVDIVTRIASVELWVLLTTVLLVLRFVLDFQGPWFGNPGSMRRLVVVNLEIVNQSLVIYTMGLMQLSGPRKVNDYFQVWAVLLVTLQYSVKVGRPYTRSKQVPLLDLMSSFWSANLLRAQTFYLLRIPLWTIWSLNAVRIIVTFVISSEGEASNQESMRLVSDYMRYEATLSSSSSSASGAGGGGEQRQQEQHIKTVMSGYKYVVHGEHRVLREVQADAGRRREGRRRRWRSASGGAAGRYKYKIRLDPDGQHREKFITVERIWADSAAAAATSDSDRGRRWWSLGGSQLKDLCLSFALYKLLRRRFYDLPMHELATPQGKEKMRRLVVDYVLGGGGEDEDHHHPAERAFRVTGAELSFLRDLFYSKHASMFAGGLWVPLRGLLLSLSLATATGYAAYPARYIPARMDPADRNRITHGVFITRLMVAIIVLKEVLGVFLYVSSPWARVLMRCRYVLVRHRHRSPLQWLLRLLLCLGSTLSRARSWVLVLGSSTCMSSSSSPPSCVPSVRQQNLLVQVPVLVLGVGVVSFWKAAMVQPRRGVRHGKIHLTDYTKTAILDSIKNLKQAGELDSYLSNAFSGGGDAGDDGGERRRQPAVADEWPCCDLKVDTHIILVWHIATCLCEIYFLDEVKALSAVQHRRRLRPLGTTAAAEQQRRRRRGWHEQYEAAVSLSNYCVYLVRKALVPDNRLVAWKVLDEVIREIDHVVTIRRRNSNHRSGLPWELQDVYDCLMETVNTQPRTRTRTRTSCNDCKKSKKPDDDDDDVVDVESRWAQGGHQHHQVEEEEDDDDDEDDDLDIGCSLTRMGAVLGKKLTEKYHGDAAGLWRDLATFWTGFLLHLAANTAAATHGRHLAGDTELITHLWALLTHAGFRGNNAVRGEEGLDEEDIPDIVDVAATN